MEWNIERISIRNIKRMQCFSTPPLFWHVILLESFFDSPQLSVGQKSKKICLLCRLNTLQVRWKSSFAVFVYPAMPPFMTTCRHQFSPRVCHLWIQCMVLNRSGDSRLFKVNICIVPNRTITVLIFKNRIWVGLRPGSCNFQPDLSLYPGFSCFPIC